MRLADPLLMELHHEAAGARKAIERVPEDKYGWKPHEKSMTAGRLATHIAEIPSWFKTIFEADEFFFDPAAFKPFEPSSRAELLQYFDANLGEAVTSLKAATNEQMMANWKMKTPEVTVVDLPRIAVVRAWGFSHLIHHRGQLTVYLRLLGAPVPSLYGPSADEAP